MPYIIHRECRFKIIDQCLRDIHREYRINDIVEVCNTAMLQSFGVGISKRSVQYDISILRKPPFSIELDEKLLARGIYRYANINEIDSIEVLTIGKEKLDDFVLCKLRINRYSFGLLEKFLHLLGDDVEVIEPVWLRNKFIKEIILLRKMYGVDKLKDE